MLGGDVKLFLGLSGGENLPIQCKKQTIPGNGLPGTSVKTSRITDND